MPCGTLLMPSLALNITGLAWVEQPSEARPLAKIIGAVCKAHKRRLGCAPNIILVHPDLIPERKIYRGIKLIPQRGILLHHYHAIYKKG